MASYGTMTDAELPSSAPRRVKIRCGMLCCEKETVLITRALGGPPAEPQLPGVKSYRVNLLSRTVDMTYVGDEAPMEAVKRLNECYLGAAIYETGEDEKQTVFQRCLAAVLDSHSLYVFSAQTILGVLALFFAEQGASFDQYLVLAVVAVGAIALGYLEAARMWGAMRRAFKEHGALHAMSVIRPDMGILMLTASVGAVMIGRVADAALLLWLYFGAQLMQATVIAYAAGQVDMCGAQLPSVAHLFPKGESIGLDKVVPGVTLLQVRTGESIPVDGDAVAPTADVFVDEKALTGESQPVLKNAGAKGSEGKVKAGSLLVSGFLVLRCTSKATDSFANSIQDAVQDAAARRTKTQDTVERFASVYSTVVLGTAAVFLLAGLVDNSRVWVESALLLLVLGCPCALVTAAPIVNTCGVVAAARAGCLVKEADVLDRLGRITAVCMDKTGTLTDGKFAVADVWLAEGTDITDAVAALESTSTHPLAVSIVEHQVGCITEAVEGQKMTQLRSLIKGKIETERGMGVAAKVEGFGMVRVGSAAYTISKEEQYEMKGTTKSKPDAGTTLRQFLDHRAAKSLVFGSANGKPAICYALYDKPRDRSFDAVEWMQGSGDGKLSITVAILSGDRQQVVDDVGDMLDIKTRYGGLMPEGKLRVLQELRQDNAVMMVGDGINDAPALAAADVGWAIGLGGTALASQSAHVVQTADDICLVPGAIAHGKNCKALVIQNIVLGVAPKVTLAVLTVSGAWRAPLWLAMASDAGCLIAVLLNGMRALRWPESPRIWDE